MHVIMSAAWIFKGDNMSEKFIKLTRLRTGKTISISIAQIINFETRRERTYKTWTEKRKSWFGLGPEVDVERSAYDGWKELDGCDVTTTERTPIETSYRYGPETTRCYSSGGDNVCFAVKESEERIMMLIHGNEKQW